MFVNTIIPMINKLINCDTDCNDLYNSLISILNNKTIDTLTANFIKRIIDNKHKKK